MRKLVLLAIAVIIAALPAAAVYAGPPPGGPPGLERAIAAQEANNHRILALPGVAGTAVGLTADGRAAVKIFTETAGVAGLPTSLDGVPVEVQVTGKFVAFKKPADKGRNNLPSVTILSPADGAFLPSGLVSFSATATDKEDGDVPDESITWYVKYSPEDPPLLVTTGNNFSMGLPDDTYVIEAEVTDSGGSVGSDAVLVTVGDPAPDGRWPRPVPIGVSTGNAKECASGTIGARVKDAQGNVYALSNNHVYARENKAKTGEVVVQPGLYDTVCESFDVSYLGDLSAFVRIGWTKRVVWPINYVDAAIAATTTDYLGNATPSDGYGVPGSTTAAASIGMLVQKFGRTTGQTYGTVVGVNAAVIVQYGSGDAYFEGQIIITGDPGPDFSGPGDSGSLIVTDDESCNPVGLLFAGGTGVTVANEIDRVLDAFGVTIDGK